MFFSSRHQQSAFLFELPHMVWWSFISFAFQLIYYCAKNSMRESVLSDLRGRISFRFFLLQRIDLECSPNINKLTAHICTTSDGLVTRSLGSAGFFKFWAYLPKIQEKPGFWLILGTWNITSNKIFCESRNWHFEIYMSKSTPPQKMQKINWILGFS